MIEYVLRRMCDVMMFGEKWRTVYVDALCVNSIDGDNDVELGWAKRLCVE